MTFKHQISIVGTGAVGRALVHALHEKGVFVSGLFNKTKSVADKLANEVDAETTGAFPESLEFLGQICFICVPDDLIPEIAGKLASLEGAFSNVSFVHTSGAKPASALKQLKDKGAEVASFHPLQTFDGSVNRDIFRDIYISLQGDDNLVMVLQELSEILGAKNIVVDEKQKQSLHLSAVFACNYLVALMEVANQSLNLNEPGIDALEIMTPLISKTWENITQKGVVESLTGPISRGDAETIKEHLSGLKESPKLTQLYAQLGLVTLEVAERKGSDQQKLQLIHRILEDAKL